MPGKLCFIKTVLSLKADPEGSIYSKDDQLVVDMNLSQTSTYFISRLTSLIKFQT